MRVRTVAPRSLHIETTLLFWGGASVAPLLCTAHIHLPVLRGSRRSKSVSMRCGGRRFSGTRCLWRSEEHTSELQSHSDLVCRLLLEKKKKVSQHTCVNPFINFPESPVA